MDERHLITKIQQLDDMELTMLLSIVAKQHCLIETPADGLDATEDHIELMAEKLFGLSCISVDCSKSTTLDEFTTSLLAQSSRDAENSKRESDLMGSLQMRSSRYSHSQSGSLTNIVIARNLSAAPRQVQIQALELLRTGRMFTHAGVYNAPSPFLFMILQKDGAPRLVEHLNDFVFMSQQHIPKSYAAPSKKRTADAKSKTAANGDGHNHAIGIKEDDALRDTISAEDIEALIKLRQEVTTTIEVKRYMHDVLVFLRMHRAVADGATPKATRHFELLTRCLALCNGLHFVSPSLVALAARKIYRHRLRLVSVAEERSMQYGSDPELVAQFLKGLTPGLVIDEVLAEIEVPV